MTKKDNASETRGFHQGGIFISQEDKIETIGEDMWNAYMVRGASFSPNDIPFCPTTADDIPHNLISYSEAKTIYNKQIKSGNKNFFVNAYVHFYISDVKFDGKISGIWYAPSKAVEILRHFAGIITPDFSTYADFPKPIKSFNTYRMRAFGYWYGTLLGHAVINNVRWGTEETFEYCFDGIPKNSIVSIGTVASGLKRLCNRKMFETGFKKMLEVLQPYTIIIYGSDQYSFFDEVRDKIKIVHFRSETDLALQGDANE